MISKKKILKSTIYSILIFLSLSFISLLPYLNSLFYRYDNGFEHKIGFPFTYYHEFIINCPTPNSGWNLGNLFLDVLLIWVFVTGLYFLMKLKT